MVTSPPTLLLAPNRLDPAEISMYERVLKEGGAITPRVDHRAAVGFVYPLVNEMLGLGPDRDIDYLVMREGQNLLRHSFFDRVNLCPGCFRANVNFRESCPECSNTEIAFERVIHHFRCAHVGREELFRQGFGLVCPKCSQQLRSIGKDFERPAELHYCGRCDALFPEPDLEGLCLYCAKRFPQGERVSRDIVQFHATAAIVPAIRGLTWEAAVRTGVSDELPHVLSYQFLLAMLDVEIQRAARYERPLSIVVLSADVLRAVDITRRTFETTTRLYDFIQKLEKIKRTTDIIGRLPTGDLVFVLTETAYERTVPMIQRLDGALGDGVPGSLSAGAAAAIAGERQSPEQLIERAVAALTPLE